MSKKNKKKRKDKVNLQKKLTPAQILQKFKNFWAADNWQDALSYYRAWTNKTNSKRSPQIEGELLFRLASTNFSTNNYERAVQYLDEAIKINTGNSNRFNRFKAACIAKMGHMEESKNLFDSLNDDFHTSILSYFIKQKKPLPGKCFNDPPFFSFVMTDFLKKPGETEAFGKINPSLNNIGKAFKLFMSGKDPGQQLNLLKKRDGFEQLAVHLLLIVSIYKKSTIKTLDIIKKYSKLIPVDYFQGLFITYFKTLLEEKDYKKIVESSRIFSNYNIHIKEMDKIKDEMFFRMGLEALEDNDSWKALDYFLKISETTSPVIHNIALCCRDIEEFGRANEYWIRLLHREKKPTKNSSKEKILSYCTTLKYIGQNFLHDFEYEKAFPYFKEVLKFEKNDREALESLFAISVEMYEHQNSLLYSKRLYELEPGNEEYMFSYVIELKHSNRLDILLPILKKILEKYPGNLFFCQTIVDCYAEMAWRLRKKSPEEAEKLIKEGGKYKIENVKLLFQEGLLKSREGNRKGAAAKFNKVVKARKSHGEEYFLAVAFYEEGIIDYAYKLFKMIASCACEKSDDLFKESLFFLVKHDDYENVKSLCEIALGNKGYWLIDIADLLYDMNRPSWAKEFSSRALSEEESDEGDIYLHMLILNKTGEKEELLQFALKQENEAKKKNDFESMAELKEIIRQVRTRGRFKE